MKLKAYIYISYSRTYQCFSWGGGGGGGGGRGGGAYRCIGGIIQQNPYPWVLDRVGIRPRDG